MTFQISQYGGVTYIQNCFDSGTQNFIIPSLLGSSCPLRFICSSKMTNETSKPNPDTTRGGDQSCCFKPKNHNKFRFFFLNRSKSTCFDWMRILSNLNVCEVQFKDVGIF